LVKLAERSGFGACTMQAIEFFSGFRQLPIYFLFMYLPQTHGPYHKGNQIRQGQKMVSHSAIQTRCYLINTVNTAIGAKQWNSAPTMSISLRVILLVQTIAGHFTCLNVSRFRNNCCLFIALANDVRKFLWRNPTCRSDRPIHAIRCHHVFLFTPNTRRKGVWRHGCCFMPVFIII